MTKLFFGKHNGQELSEIPSGYLRWVVEKLDPVPLPQYRFHEDGTAMTVEEVKDLEERYRGIISAAEDELIKREEK